MSKPTTPTIWYQCDCCTEAGEMPNCYPVDEMRWYGKEEWWVCENCLSSILYNTEMGGDEGQDVSDYVWLTDYLRQTPEGGEVE